jgi:hemerythrin
MESGSEFEILNSQSSCRISNDKSDNDTDAILDGILDMENSHSNFVSRVSLLFVKTFFTF